jgi:phosphatidylinositol alpha-1,6-mannosyltransferase
MDVLVLTWNYPPRRGGVENLLQNLCAGLREQHRVFIVTSSAKPPQSAEPDTFRAPLSGLIPFAFYVLWRGALVLAHYPQIGVVFGGSALVTPLVLILARLFRRRAVVLTHGLDVIHRNFFYQWLCVQWLKFCDRVVANSNYTAALVASKAVAQERLTVIPPGVHAEHFSIPTDVIATKRHWNIEGKEIVLFVGRLAKRKGLKEFIEKSLVEIVREIPETVFLIVGDNPTESLAHRADVISEIDEAVSRLGLNEQVRLLGALGDDEAVGLYHACDVVVLPALDMKNDVEGFGIVALEAAAACKPVVATRVGGIADAVENSKTGILVEPGDYQALTHAVLWLLRDSSQAWTMGSAGRQRAMNLFAWKQICHRHAKTLSSGISAVNQPFV